MRMINLIALFTGTIILAACGSNARTTPTKLPPTVIPSNTPTPTKTPVPSLTPTPSITPTITPTFTPNPTEIVESYMSMLGEFLSTQHDVEVEGMSIEPGILKIRIRSNGSGQSFLRLISWQVIEDLSKLLQILGPNTELLIDIIGSDDYAVDLLVLSEDGSTGFRSVTNREAFNAVQEGVLSYDQWEVLANGHFEEF